MSKGIVFRDSQIKAFNNGATMFILPFNLEYKHNNEYMKKLIEAHAPIQKGEEFFIKEEFVEGFEDIESQTQFNGSEDIKIWYKADNTISEWSYPDDDEEHCAYESYPVPWQDASQMQEHQSRYKNIKCIDIRVKRVQDISHNKGEIYKIYPDAHQDGYDNFMHGFNEKFCNGRYEDNDYIFLIEIKQ